MSEETYPGEPRADEILPSSAALDIEAIQERAAETLRENALAQEHADQTLERIREGQLKSAYLLGRIDGLLEAAKRRRRFF